MAQPVGGIDVLASGQPREDRLAQKTRRPMAAILPRARIADQSRRHVRQAEGIIQFPMQQQTTVRTDRRPTKCQLDRAVKFKPKRTGFRFTRRIPCQIPAPFRLTH